MNPFNNNTQSGVNPRQDNLSHAECVEPLGTPSVARQLAVTATSASVALSALCTRVSLLARGDAARFVIQQGSAPTAVATSHYIAAGERLDFAVERGSFIAALRVTNDCTLEITELS